MSNTGRTVRTHSPHDDRERRLGLVLAALRRRRAEAERASRRARREALSSFDGTGRAERPAGAPRDLPRARS